MEYKDIEKVVSEMRTVEIHGNPYPEVVEKIKAFKKIFPHGSITTEMIADDGEKVVFKAAVWDEDRILGTGHAYELRTSSYINKTSYIENCETSAVGRALSNAGFGGDKSIASLEEVAHAMVQQEEGKKSQIKDQLISEVKVRSLLAKANDDGVDINKLCQKYQVKSLENLTEAMLSEIVNNWSTQILTSCKA